MSRLSRLVIVAFLFVFALRVPLLSAPRWPQDESNLKPDAAATFGTLPNAIRYVILPNKEPKDRVSLRLLVLAGSLEETEEQRGLAHFLEHMAFNGSTHYAPGTLVEFFQRMGMSFGGDTNAYTSFDHTLY
ncbi:MAG TPA: insulinase family protein, partial [Opitutaceae bacterium]|nr:insulinase family protein [Opitutaceae bacterium]